MKSSSHSFRSPSVALVLSFFMLSLASCGGSSASSPDGSGVGHKPSSRGQAFELVVIIPEQLYEGEVRDSLDALVRASTPVLPQHEPLFRLNMVWADANLTSWRTFRERFVVRVNTKAPKATVGVARDAVAVPQFEVLAEAPSRHELAVLLGRERERIQDFFVDHELDFMAAALRRKHSAATAKAFRELTGHSICVPAALKASKQAVDFLWTGTNLNDRDQNFVCYSYAWDGLPLTAEQFVAKRDSALKANIPGSRPGQWMQTARIRRQEGGEKVPLTVSRARIINNVPVHEVHGLWELHDGALGGAFVALERIDSVARRVLVTEGFIYSPHSPKRNIMREMEAALRTFE